MKIEGNGFRYFINGKEVLYKDLQKLIRLDMTVKIEGLNVYYNSPQKENKTEDMHRLIEEELERQEKNDSKSTRSFLEIAINELMGESKPSRIEEVTKIITEGKKENNGKPQISLLFKQFPKALEAITRCSEYGHLKYESTDADYLNYQRVEEGSKAYADAGLRHRMHKTGTTDLESQLPHAYHVAWNALAELELLIKENLAVSK